MFNKKNKLKTVKSYKKYKTAWNPDHLRYIAVFCSMIPGALIYCINYKRLEDPEKKKKIFTVLAVTAVFTAFAFLVPANKIFYILFFMINLLISMYFAYDQKQVYDDFIKNGGYRATIVRPLILSILAIVVYFVVIALLI